MTKTILKTLAGVAALAAVAAGASAIAGASDKKAAGAAAAPGPAPYGAPMPYGAPGGPPRGAMHFRGGRPPAAVTGATADKVKAAALAKYPGAKIERVDQRPDGTYVAHVIKGDGTEVHVLVNKQFEVTGTEQARMGGRFPGGPGPGHPPAAVTGATADKVKAAALAKYPGAKIERVDQVPDGTYVAHVIKKDGTEVHVAVNKQFEVTGELKDHGFGPPGGKMPGHPPDGQMPPPPYGGSGAAPPPPPAPNGKRARPQAPAPPKPRKTA